MDTTPSVRERLRAVMDHFGLTPLRASLESGGRFSRHSVKSWVEGRCIPRADTAVSFASWLCELNRLRENCGKPPLAPRFLTAEYLFGNEEDKARTAILRPDPEKVQGGDS